MKGDGGKKTKKTIFERSEHAIVIKIGIMLQFRKLCVNKKKIKIWHFDLVSGPKNPIFLSYVQPHTKATSSKNHPFKDLILSNVWCKFQVNWKSRTEVKHLDSLIFAKLIVPLTILCSIKPKPHKIEISNFANQQTIYRSLQRSHFRS